MSRAQLIFSVNETKGVLVISPAGDAISFRDVDVAAAVNDLLSRVNALPQPRVVIDLGGSQYFGSIMIGAVSQVAERVRERGGVFAVCSLSPDMQQVLTAMKLADRWPTFDTQKAAVKFTERCEA
ncbi:MAG: STAS domain-containing protein [Planctomycetaceae bacterium]|nr:STAS domain-containing protein [Planctomycetaceae bacterium]